MWAYQTLLAFLGLCATWRCLPPCLLPAHALPASDMVKSGEKVEPSPEILLRAQRPRTLILTEDASFSKTHSRLVSTLQGDGHQLTIRLVDDPAVKLTSLGEALYDNIVLAAPALKGYSSKGIDRNEFEKFVDGEGRKSLLLLGYNGGLAIRLLVKSFGMLIDSAASQVQDQFSVGPTINSAAGGGSSILTTSVKLRGTVFDEGITSVAFTGYPHELSASNALVFPLLVGSPTTLYHKRNAKSPAAANITTGPDAILISAFQARNNARVTFTGSFEMCGDALISQHPSNLVFCRDLARWTFQQKGVLEWSQLRHHKVGETEAPYAYRIKDEVEFSLDLHELDGEGVWKPFRSSDVQLAFTMLDPHLRVYLTSPQDGEDSATHHVQFKAPDRYGIFKFVVEYNRKGYSFLNLESLAPLRNFKHNDYDRFLWCAYPYYGGTFVSIALVVIFAVVFMYADPSAADDLTILSAKVKSQ